MNGLIVMVLMQQTTYCRVGKVRRLGFLMVEEDRQPDIRRSIDGIVGKGRRKSGVAVVDRGKAPKLETPIFYDQFDFLLVLNEN